MIKFPYKLLNFSIAQNKQCHAPSRFSQRCVFSHPFPLLIREYRNVLFQLVLLQPPAVFRRRISVDNDCFGEDRLGQRLAHRGNGLAQFAALLPRICDDHQVILMSGGVLMQPGDQILGTALSQGVLGANVDNILKRRRRSTVHFEEPVDTATRRAGHGGLLLLLSGQVTRFGVKSKHCSCPFRIEQLIEPLAIVFGLDLIVRHAARRGTTRS